jgi:uncharacterized cupredoxin-like copper-binding protein
MSIDDRPTLDEEEPAAPPLPPPTTEMLFGAGQSAWLALVTVGVLLALGMSIVALVLATGDDGGGVASPTAPATALTVDADEFSFDPADAVVVADTDVEVTLDNTGAVAHNWTVLELGTTVTDEADYDPAMAIAEVAADPGGSASSTVNLPAGDYQVICTIAGHLAAGMEGTLEVVP